jgi:hypothetical protein
MQARAFALVLGLVAAAAGFGCGGGSAAPVQGGGLGDPCVVDLDCREGLRCGDSGTCELKGDHQLGEPCALTGECASGLYCGPERICAGAGTTPDGGACATTADCERGLVCVLEGFGFVCRSGGDGQAGAECASDRDCLAGLSCLPTAQGGPLCTSPPALGDGGVALPNIPTWAGETCETESEAPRAFFDVPRGDGTDKDFYRLPFPNDIRRTDTGLDLSGHPSPGTALPVDIIDRYLRASETDLHGFATNPVVYFRFNRAYNWDTISPAIRFVDITPGSPTYDRGMSFGWLVTVGPTSRYICDDWLAVRPLHGHPLRPGTTYAVILSRNVELAGNPGALFGRSPDLVAVLADTRPTEERLGRAWDAYAPLRDWMGVKGYDSDFVLTAAVFTTQEPEALMPKLREVVRADTMPALSDLTECQTGVVSPCDDGGPRVCGAPDSDFVEIHGRIDLPIFQQGTPPYETPEEGGGIEVDSTGTPLVARHEPVCFALTLPRGQDAPAAGFPLLVYLHGTGGSFRGAITDTLAKAVAAGDLDGTAVHAATLAIDLPEHGERRGASTLDPAHLFFNFLNPRAARDNYAQGAADLMTLARWAGEFHAAASDWVTGQEVKFDPSRLVVYAHSQGASHAALAIPYEPAFSAVVLSGNGGDLTQSLLTKTNPIDIAGVLPYALLDYDGEGHLGAGQYHPALALFQAFFERVDPVNYAWRLQREPLAGDPGRHVFMTYGLGDTYSTEPTMQAYAVAGNLVQVLPTLVNFDLPTREPPLAGNAQIDGQGWTIGLRQYQPPPGVDGHFVALESSDGRADVLRFLLGALAGETPEIGTPLNP